MALTVPIQLIFSQVCDMIEVISANFRKIYTFNFV